jgi:hypothetical protein
MQRARLNLRQSESKSQTLQPYVVTQVTDNQIFTERCEPKVTDLCCAGGMQTSAGAKPGDVCWQVETYAVRFASAQHPHASDFDGQSFKPWSRQRTRGKRDCKKSSTPHRDAGSTWAGDLQFGRKPPTELLAAEHQLRRSPPPSTRRPGSPLRYSILTAY